MRKICLGVAAALTLCSNGAMAEDCGRLIAQYGYWAKAYQSCGFGTIAAEMSARVKACRARMGREAIERLEGEGEDRFADETGVGGRLGACATAKESYPAFPKW